MKSNESVCCRRVGQDHGWHLDPPPSALTHQHPLSQQQKEVAFGQKDHLKARELSHVAQTVAPWAAGDGQQVGEEARTFTHRVRIFGMWLKLVTRMRLMLLLLRVLRRQREKGEGKQGSGLRGTKMLTEVGERRM